MWLAFGRKLNEFLAIKDPGQINVFRFLIFLHFKHRNDTPEVLFLQFQKVGRFDEYAFDSSCFKKDLGRRFRFRANETLDLLDGHIENFSVFGSD